MSISGVISKAREAAKACPHCGGKNLGFDYESDHGQGETIWTLSGIRCNDCVGGAKTLGGSGFPTDLSELKAWHLWNNRKNEGVNPYTAEEKAFIDYCVNACMFQAQEMSKKKDQMTRDQIEKVQRLSQRCIEFLKKHPING